MLRQETKRREDSLEQRAFVLFNQDYIINKKNTRYYILYGILISVYTAVRYSSNVSSRLSRIRSEDSCRLKLSNEGTWEIGK
jgi:hypothetical protein